MAVASGLVRVEIIDTQVFWKYSKAHKVGAIPRTFFNYGDNFVGVETEEQILRRAQAAQ